jgi:carboxypeptidase Q
MFFRIIISLMLVLSPSSDAGTPSSADILSANLLSPTPIFEDLRYLTDDIGGRPTGSPAMERALQWGLRRLIDAGFKDAYLDPYTAPVNWLPNIETGVLITDSMSKKHVNTPVRIVGMPMTVSTPAAGIEAPVFGLHAMDVNEIKQNAPQIEGHWLLIPTTPMHTVDDLFKEYLDTLPVFSAAKDAGAVGILWQSTRPGRLLYRHSVTLNGRVFPLPAAVIEREGSEKMMRSLKASEAVKFKANLSNYIQEHPKNYNVVAEIKGAEKPNEVILLGAHLDSWDLGQGALDNGCNVAMVIDAARQIFALKKYGFTPKRTIRFVLYTGEELGIYGSKFDIKDHPERVQSIKAVVIYDLGSGRTTGFSLGGRSDMKSLVDEALQPVIGLGPFVQTTDAFVGTDNFDYLLQGIPTLVANQDAGPYLPSYHAESDTFDKVDQRELKLNTLIAAILTWNIANTDTEIPAQQTKHQVAQLLDTTGLKEQMIALGLWEDFVRDKA